MALIFVIMLMITAILAITNFFKVPHAYEYIIERLGKYHKVCKAGPHIKMPFIDTIRNKVDLREIVCDFEPQPAITKDNVTIDIDAVVYMKVVDSNKYTYGVNDPISALSNLTATTLRNIIGYKSLDETLTSRDDINTRMRDSLDEAVGNWGMDIVRVEVKNITPPPEVKEAMEVEMRAEREKRSAITRAEGEKKAAILRAEGEQTAAKLNAEAIKIQTIAQAEAEAEALRIHKIAEAEGINRLLSSGLSMDEVIRLRSLSSLEKAADGQSTKIIVPSDISNLSGIVTSLKETTSHDRIADPAPGRRSSADFPENRRRSEQPIYRVPSATAPQPVKVNSKKITPPGNNGSYS